MINFSEGNKELLVDNANHQEIANVLALLVEEHIRVSDSNHEETTRLIQSLTEHLDNDKENK
jgi:hypothetical protein